MKGVSKKSIGFFAWISRHAFVTSVIMCAAFAFVYIAANGFMITSGNDDYCVFKTFLGGNTAVPCVGYFVTSFCALIQPLFGKLNIYMILQELICFFSLTAIDYFLLAKLGAKRGLFYAVIFDTVFFSFLIVEILYTYTAVVASTAGFLCLFYACCYEQCKWRKRLQLIGGFALVLIGSQMRFQPFAACCGIALVYAVAALAAFIVKNRKNSGFKTACAQALKKYLTTGIMLVAAIASAVGVNAVSEAIKNSSEDYRELSHYYESLSSVIDTRINPFYKNPEKFKELGMDAHDDFMTLRMWFIDDHFYTSEKLNRLSAVIREDIDDGIDNKSVFEKVLFAFKKTSEKMLENGSMFLFLFVLALAVFGVVIGSILFPKNAGTLIKLLLLALICSLYIGISLTMISESKLLEWILLFPLMAVSLLITLRCHARQAIITLSVLAAMLIPFSYLVTIRFVFRASMSVIFPAFVMIVFGIDTENLITFQKRPRIAGIALSAVALAFVAVSVNTGIYVFKQQVFTFDAKSNQKLNQYIEDHPDTVFLVNQIMLTRRYYDPLVLPSEKPNLVNYGLWLPKAKCFKKAQAENGIENIFKDSIDSHMQIIIYEKDLPESSENDVFNSFLTTYYNNHYAEDGEEIEIRRVGNAGKYSLFEVFSKSAAE